MHLSDPTAAARRGLSVALLAALVSPLAAGAQELLPRVEVRQVGDLRWAWQNEARVKLDRDAFLVVAELGADGRLRIVYPARPDQSAYTRSNKPIYTELPSSDAMFIRANWVRVPTVIAFASDVAPDLSSFRSDGKTWEFEYNVTDGAGEREVVNALAEVLYGSLDMPFSVATTRSAPVLSAFAISTLNSCGFPLGGNIANDFRSFLWEAYGPFAIGSRRAFFGDYGSDWHRNLFLSTYMPFPFSGFQRNIGGGLWNRYGAGCPGLAQQAPLFFIASGDVPTLPLPPDSIGDVEPPKDRDGKPPKVVDDVKLVPASPAAMERRGNAVRDAATKVATASGSGNGVAQRSERSELVQRSQVAQAIAMITSRNALGMDGPASNGANQRRGWVRNAASGGSGGYGGSGTVTRASGSGAGGGSTGVGTSSGSAGSSSAGSGASSGEGRGGEGTTGGGRTGTGRP